MAQNADSAMTESIWSLSQLDSLQSSSAKLHFFDSTNALAWAKAFSVLSAATSFPFSLL